MSVSAAVPAPQQLKNTIRNVAEIQLPKGSIRSGASWKTSTKFRDIDVFEYTCTVTALTKLK